MKNLKPRFLLLPALSALVMSLLLARCGSSSSTPPGSTNASVALNLSDDATEDWATIGIKIQSIAFNPKGGGTPVTVYTAPSPTPTTNLIQLNELVELLSGAQVAPGTYASATLTVAANPGDVSLTVATDPEAGFAGLTSPGAGQVVNSSNIIIRGATGAAGSKTVTIPVNFSKALTFTAGTATAININFNLAHPTFIIAHAVSGSATNYVVNFSDCVRHKPFSDLRRLVMRHHYGTVTSVSADNTSVTLTKDFPVYPATNPETAIASKITLSVLADAANGTIYYDVDAKTRTVIKDFSSVATTLPTKFVRFVPRYQSDGTIVAVRLWASTSFNKVWVSPEGVVLHMPTSNSITVMNEDATATTLTVDANTQFYFRVPQSAVADATPIGTGTAFLSNIQRGFKVHVSVDDPLATPLVAQTVDIENAAFSGTLSSVGSTSFIYTRTFSTAGDDYTATLDYISSSTAHEDPSGNAITGFEWWNLTFPTLADTGTSAVSDFEAAVASPISFGGSPAVTLSAFGTSAAIWADAANPTGWAVPFTILTPVATKLGTVSTAWATGTSSGTFAMTVTVTGGAATPVTVDVSTVSGSAPLVYQVDKTSGVVTTSPVDVTTSTGITAVTTNLTAGTSVRVYGVPETNGHLRAYVVYFYTGTAPSA